MANTEYVFTNDFVFHKEPDNHDYYKIKTLNKDMYMQLNKDESGNMLSAEKRSKFNVKKVIIIQAILDKNNTHRHNQKFWKQHDILWYKIDKTLEKNYSIILSVENGDFPYTFHTTKKVTKLLQDKNKGFKITIMKLNGKIIKQSNTVIDAYTLEKLLR